MFDVKRRSLTLFSVLPKPEVVLSAKRWQMTPYIVLKSNRNRLLRVGLCGFRHISTFGLGVGASLASFIAVFGRPLSPYATGERDHSPPCPICKVDELWLNGWMDQDATWYGDRPRPWLHCVRWGSQPPTKKGTTASHFSGHVYGGQTVAHLSNCSGLVSLSHSQ